MQFLYCELYTEQGNVFENIHVKSIREVQNPVNSNQWENGIFPGCINL